MAQKGPIAWIFFFSFFPFFYFFFFNFFFFPLLPLLPHSVENTVAKLMQGRPRKISFPPKSHMGHLEATHIWVDLINFLYSFFFFFYFLLPTFPFCLLFFKLFLLAIFFISFYHVPGRGTSVSSGSREWHLSQCCPCRPRILQPCQPEARMTA